MKTYTTPSDETLVIAHIVGISRIEFLAEEPGSGHKGKFYFYVESPFAGLSCVSALIVDEPDSFATKEEAETWIKAERQKLIDAIEAA